MVAKSHGPPSKGAWMSRVLDQQGSLGSKLQCRPTVDSKNSEYGTGTIQVFLLFKVLRLVKFQLPGFYCTVPGVSLARGRGGAERWVFMGSPPKVRP